MKKSELVTGMVVTTRSKEKFMVFKGIESIYTDFKHGEHEDCLVSLDELSVWNSLVNYHENLYYAGTLGSDADIMKVEIINHPCDFQTIFVKKETQKNLTLLWEREEVKEVTMAEIEKKFGCKIKIVERKE